MLMEECPVGPDAVVLVKPESESGICASSGLSDFWGSSEEPFCRICHEGVGVGDLLSPCQCSGSLATVHRVCLEHWLTASGSSRCELCHAPFPLERRPKPLTEWLTAPSMQHQRRSLCGDALCFLFITPLAALSGWLCVRGAVDLYYSNTIQAAGLLMLTLTLLTIYLFWTAVSLRYHVHLFRTWNETNPSVRLQIPRTGTSSHHHHHHQHQQQHRKAFLTVHFFCKHENKETGV